MDPKKPKDNQQYSVPPHDSSMPARSLEREAATQIMRQQIDQLYDQEPATSIEAPILPSDPYHQTHSETADHKAAEAHDDSWKQYHTQWQQYYQQYYERYYTSQLHARQQQITGQAAPAPELPTMITAGEPVPDADTLSKSQAASEIREQLLNKVREHSKRVRSSRHFVPIVAALIVALTFGFLQYNSLIFGQVKAYVSPGSISPANLIVDPTTELHVGPEPKLVIPKINVDAPVVYDVPSLAENIIQQKLKSGVVHYPIPGANSMPGEQGNTVVLGHSSNDVFDDGAYKFVFVQLNNLEKGDTFYLHYNGTRYTYSVTEKKVIDPSEVGQLVINNGKPLATLVTCTPPGTALKRLVVIAEQISPDPNKAAAAASQTDGNADSLSLPGDGPTLFERLFGGR